MDETIPAFDLYLVETNWPDKLDEWDLHSIYPRCEMAKVAGRTLFEALPYDVEGCGVRVRGGTLEGCEIRATTRSIWTEWCKFPKIKDAVGRRIIEEEDDDG